MKFEKYKKSNNSPLSPNNGQKNKGRNRCQLLKRFTTELVRFHKFEYHINFEKRPE